MINVHAIDLRNGADVQGSRDRAGDGRLLFVVCDTLARKVRRTTLGDLKDDRGLDIAGRIKCGLAIRGTRGKWRLNGSAYRAASRTALATEEEVTFY
jgi:hypothetical protein